MSDAASLPSLRLPSGVSEEQQQFNRSVMQWIQMREGQQGSDQERVVLRRDLPALGGAGGTGGLVASAAALPANALGQLAASARAQEFAAFAGKILATRVFQNLMAGTNDASRFDQLDQRLQTLLAKSIAEEAAARGTAISRIDETIQNESEQRATVIQELTAAVGAQVAGLRTAQSVTVAKGRATAAQVTQLAARLDDADGHGATVEEVLLAVADQISGLLSQYTVKVTAGGAMAGIGVAAEDPLDGTADSYIIMAARRLAFVQDTDVLGTGAGQIDPRNPGATRIPFGIDSDGVIYLNGQVRINANGAPLLTLAKELAVTAPTQVFKQSAAGVWDSASITLTATNINGLAGVPAWTVIAGTYTGSLPAGSTLVAARANMTSDSVTFKASVTDSGATYTDTITLTKLVDGANGANGAAGVNAIVGFLTNEAHTVPALADGTVTAWTGATGTFKVFSGTTDVSASFALSTASNPQALTMSYAGQTYTVTGGLDANEDLGTVTIRATGSGAYAGVTVDKVFTLGKTKTGSQGAQGIQGAQGAQGPQGAQGVQGAVGANGLRGSVQSYYQRPAPGWSDVDANNRTYQVSGTGYLVGGDTATQSYSNTWAETRYWTGGAWVVPGVVIDGNLLVQGTITTDKMYVNAATVASASGAGTGLTGWGAGGPGVQWNGFNFALTTTGQRLKWLGSVQIDFRSTATNIEVFRIHTQYWMDGTLLTEDFTYHQATGYFPSAPTITFCTGGCQANLPVYLMTQPAAGGHTFGIAIFVEFFDGNGVAVNANGGGAYQMTGKLLVEENKV